MGVSKVLADLRPRRASSVDPPVSPVVGILAFEAAAAMSRLVSLHRSLADNEVRRLRADMRSAGVGYLTSKDQTFLLRLSCGEVISELDMAAATVSRLGPKCRDPLLHGFDRIYADLKAGSGSVKVFLRESRSAADLDRLSLGSTAKRVEKRVKKMERYVAATSTLYAEMEVLSQLEASKKRIELLQQQHWRRHSGPIPVPKPPGVPPPSGVPPPPNPIHLELRAQRHAIRRLKEESLWNKTYDKAVELMVRAVVTVFARICHVFGPCVLGLPPSRHQIHQFNLNHPGKHTSGPLDRQVVPKHVPSLRNSAPILSVASNDALKLTPFERLSKLLKEAPPNTVGGSGLALRHANLILAAERLYQERQQMAPEVEEQEVDKNAAAAAREELFQMMPSGMRAAVTAKLRECWRREGRKSSGDASMAEGWKEAVAAILVWLGPVAHDTVRWQEERNMERERRFYTRPRVLLLQTLHFADVEKTEAAIVEVLVGLSCMSWYI
ncbi:protein PSK SIMULATOR 3-like [Zingiber officinale]|uniref:protein PSK SIMULATOR 3-like n=1 Tax=Zingiber officinale TaxID=94328 RepID=UPI001C4D3D71|nr:protein PSK SIMULATOR 3-like [Zingiber officinale]